MQKFPTKVTHEIEAGKITTKIFSGEKCIATLNIKKTNDGAFTRKTHKIEEKFPEFMSEVDDFHCSTIARDLDRLRSGDHPDQEGDF